MDKIIRIFKDFVDFMFDILDGFLKVAVMLMFVTFIISTIIVVLISVVKSIMAFMNFGG